MDKMVINYVPTGMLMKKGDTPFVPVSVDEIIEDVRQAVKIGITSVHLHAREADETPSWRKEVYRDIIRGIREFAPELVIAVSTSGRFFNTFETRSDVLNLTGTDKPDMASLTLSSLNFNKVASINEPGMIVSLAGKMKEAGIRPELEAFDVGMINVAKYLIRHELLDPPYCFSMILGNIACAQPTLMHTAMMVNDVPDDSEIVFGGIGRAQLKINALAISMGYGVRVGIEDNIWLDEQRTKLATNRDFLERVHVIAKAVGREICSSAEYRNRMHLQPGNGKYGVL